MCPRRLSEVVGKVRNGRFGVGVDRCLSTIKKAPPPPLPKVISFSVVVWVRLTRELFVNDLLTHEREFTVASSSILTSETKLNQVI